MLLFGFVEENHFHVFHFYLKEMLTVKCISGYFFLMNALELQIGSNLALEFYNSAVLFYYFRIQFITNICWLLFLFFLLSYLRSEASSCFYSKFVVQVGIQPTNENETHYMN